MFWLHQNLLSFLAKPFANPAGLFELDHSGLFQFLRGNGASRDVHSRWGSCSERDFLLESSPLVDALQGLVLFWNGLLDVDRVVDANWSDPNRVLRNILNSRFLQHFPLLFDLQEGVSLNRYFFSLCLLNHLRLCLRYNLLSELRGFSPVPAQCPRACPFVRSSWLRTLISRVVIELLIIFLLVSLFHVLPISVIRPEYWLLYMLLMPWHSYLLFWPHNLLFFWFPARPSTVLLFIFFVWLYVHQFVQLRVSLVNVRSHTSKCVRSVVESLLNNRVPVIPKNLNRSLPSFPLARAPLRLRPTNSEPLLLNIINSVISTC